MFNTNYLHIFDHLFYKIEEKSFEMKKLLERKRFRISK